MSKNYNFTSLSPYDFEDLVRDLLQKELAITLESFTVGRDGGIDLRYISDEKNTLIIQCKHYSSGYSQLKSKLINEEVSKVKRLCPERYILSTSVGLTPDQKTEIKNIFSPYCKSENDVYGRDDLNNLLGKFEDIERQHFKLWLTSTNILENILHSKTTNLSKIQLHTITEKAKIYVRSQAFNRAKSILESNHYCIISGIPGIGKTVLAEMLLLDYLRNDYEVFKISGDISPAIAMIF